MAKQVKEKRPKNPKDWPGAEKNHSLKIGDKVKVEHFGVEQKDWEVIELQRHEATGLACYKLKDPNGTKWPYIGKWQNDVIFTRIIS